MEPIAGQHRKEFWTAFWQFVEVLRASNWPECFSSSSKELLHCKADSGEMLQGNKRQLHVISSVMLQQKMWILVRRLHISRLPGNEINRFCLTCLVPYSSFYWDWRFRVSRTWWEEGLVGSSCPCLSFCNQEKKKKVWSFTVCMCT